MLRLIRTCAVAVLALQLVLRLANHFVFQWPKLEVISVTDLCLLCLVITTSYMGIACGEKLSAEGFQRMYKRR